MHIYYSPVEHTAMPHLYIGVYDLICVSNHRYCHYSRVSQTQTKDFRTENLFSLMITYRQKSVGLKDDIHVCVDGVDKYPVLFTMG